MRTVLIVALLVGVACALPHSGSRQASSEERQGSGERGGLIGNLMQRERQRRQSLIAALEYPGKTLHFEISTDNFFHKSGPNKSHSRSFSFDQITDA
jgi:hypothetical protein